MSFSDPQQLKGLNGTVSLTLYYEGLDVETDFRKLDLALINVLTTIQKKIGVKKITGTYLEHENNMEDIYEQLPEDSL